MSRQILTLDEDGIVAIRRALLIGLDCFGEVERLIDITSLPENQAFRPLHPTGNNNTISHFVEALSYLETAKEGAA